MRHPRPCRACNGSKQQALLCARVRSAHGINRNALDQPLGKRRLAIKRVNQVAKIIVFKRSAQAQHALRLKPCQILLRLLAFKAVWLINNEHGLERCQRLHIAFGTPAKQVGLHPALVDGVFVFVKRLVRCHQHANTAVGRVYKLLHRFRAVVKHAHTLAAVLTRKKRCRALQAFERALPNGIARHKHNKLAQLVLLVQAVHGFDKGKGFARTCFHQHIYI